MPHISYIAKRGLYVGNSQRNKAYLSSSYYFDVPKYTGRETGSDSGICPDSKPVAIDMRI